MASSLRERQLLTEQGQQGSLLAPLSMHTHTHTHTHTLFSQPACLALSSSKVWFGVCIHFIEGKEGLGGGGGGRGLAAGFSNME